MNIMSDFCRDYLDDKGVKVYNDMIFLSSFGKDDKLLLLDIDPEYERLTINEIHYFIDNIRYNLEEKYPDKFEMCINAKLDTSEEDYVYYNGEFFPTSDEKFTSVSGEVSGDKSFTPIEEYDSTLADYVNIQVYIRLIN